MKDTVKVAVVQFEPAPYDQKEKNLTFMLGKISELGKEGHELIIFPELSLSNFFRHYPGARRDYWEEASEDVAGESVGQITKAASEVNAHVVFGMAQRSDKNFYFYNSVVLVGPNGVIGTHHKIHLPQFEKFYFLPGGEPKAFATPLGKIGMINCYDLFFPETARILGLKGAEIMVMVGSVWMGGTKGGIGGIAGLEACKKRAVEHFPITQAIANQAHFIQAGAGGSYDVGFGPWQRLGLSRIVNCLGEVLDGVEDAKDAIITATLKNEDIALQRAGFTFFMDRTPWLYTKLTEY